MVPKATTNVMHLGDINGHYCLRERETIQGKIGTPLQTTQIVYSFNAWKASTGHATIEESFESLCEYSKEKEIPIFHLENITILQAKNRWMDKYVTLDVYRSWNGDQLFWNALEEIPSHIPSKRITSKSIVAQMSLFRKARKGIDTFKKEFDETRQHFQEIRWKKNRALIFFSNSNF